MEGKEDKFHETLSAKLLSISYWKQESDDARLNMFKRNKEKGNIVYNRAQDFLETIENRDNSIRNKPHVQEAPLDPRDPKEKLNLKVTDEIRYLNFHLIDLEKTGESVEIYKTSKNPNTKVETKSEIVSLGKNAEIKKGYDDVFFNQYKCHLVIEILRNIRWKGWVMLFLIFSGSYIIFWLLVMQPDIWSHISKLF